MFTVNKLKISGFKSFAYSTEILIEDGVTGIIGPNGCGKSNIFEAIRWVMGESSSRNLRSGSIDDIIFNGTQNVPAKNIAEVSLELKDFNSEIPQYVTKDEKKVIISRQLERGVGSFFKINNKDARAKDVSILFYDSGSGARSSSIIGQGNIDQIINFKPIERKIILEDAAGTSGLHARRHESELKLQATEVNLEKIDLNLNSLYENQKNLSRQARQADRYEQISRDIKEYQSKLIFLEWKKIEENLNNCLEQKNNLREHVGLLIQRISKLKTQNELKKKSLADLQQKKEELNKSLFQLENQINGYKGKIENLKNKKEEIEKFLKTVMKDKENEENYSKEINENIKQMEHEIASLNDPSNEKDIIKELSKTEGRIKNEIKQLETLYVNEIQLSLGEEFKHDNLKENMESLERKKGNIDTELESLQSKKKTDQLKLESINKNLEELKTLNLETQTRLDQEKQTLTSHEKNKSNLDDEIKFILEKIEVKSLLFAEIQTEIKTLSQITGKNSLSSQSIVNLLKIKKGYENAVYGALTHELDATLTSSKKRWVKKKIVNLTNIDNPLSNFVESPKELIPILSQIGVISENKDPLEMQKNLSVGQMLVDKNGTIWRWDGFISEDNLQKKKIKDSYLRITELCKKEKELNKELIELEKKKEVKKKDELKSSEYLINVRSNVEKLYMELDRLSPKISELKEQNSILNLNIENNSNKITTLEVELKDSVKQINEIKSLDLLSSDKINKTETDNVQSKISDLDKKLESVRNEINLLKQKLIKEELRKNYFQNDVVKSKKRLEESLKKITVLQKRQEFYENEKKKLSILPSDLVEKINNLQGEYNEVNDLVKKNLALQQELLMEISNEEKNLSKIDNDRESKKNEATIVETNILNYKSKEKEYREIIFQKTSMQPEDIENKYTNETFTTEHFDEIKNSLQRLNYQREQMGPVNLRARIEEQEIKKALEDLELEKNDLVQAIEKLRLGISKINNEGKKRLTEAFEKVDKNFCDLFKKLFNGGEAKLELIKSDDPLQTGIEIYARPPGKKLSSLSLLSGGEKTLTAISLIFSIFLINPSPICILDEVDAALDEINVQKFCTLLNELKNSTKTKFLIITHNKITMSSLDRVYGVTMTQKGISDVVSVDFKKIDLKKAV